MQRIKPREEFINKIYAVQILMAVVIVFAHAATFTHVQAGGGPDFIAVRFFNDLTSFTGAALSVFMTISSFLLFYNYDSQNAQRKIKDRLLRNLIPFFAWNTLGILYTRPAFQGIEDVLSWYLLSNGCPVFWFLEMVTVLALLAPLNYAVFKHKKVGILLLIVLGIFTLAAKPDFHQFAFLTDEVAIYLNRFRSYIYAYTLGVFLALHFRDFVLRESYGKVANMIGRFVIVYLLFAPNNTLYHFLFMHAFLFVWIATDLEVYKQKRWYQTMSFFLYAAHPLALSLVHRLFNGLHLDGLLADVPVSGIYALFWRTVLSFATIAITLGVGFLLQKYVPFVYALAIGNRKTK